MAGLDPTISVRCTNAIGIADKPGDDGRKRRPVHAGQARK